MTTYDSDLPPAGDSSKSTPGPRMAAECCGSGLRISDNRQALLYFGRSPSSTYVKLDLTVAGGVRPVSHGKVNDQDWLDSQPFELLQAGPSGSIESPTCHESVIEQGVAWPGNERNVTPVRQIAVKGKKLKLRGPYAFPCRAAISPSKRFLGVFSNHSHGSAMLVNMPDYLSFQIFRLADLTEVFSVTFGGAFGGAGLKNGWINDSDYVFIRGEESLTKIEIIRPR